MATNDLSPAFIKLRYAVSSRVHYATYQVEPEGVPVPGVEPQVRRKDGTPTLMSTAVVAWVNVIKASFFTSSDFQSAEMWYKATPTGDPIFIYSISLGTVGSSVTATRVSGQYTQTFRTVGGSVMRIMLMEPAAALTDAVDSFPYSAGTNKNISDFILGATNWIKGRDDTWPVTGMRTILKTNDALRKKFLNI